MIFLGQAVGHHYPRGLSREEVGTSLLAIGPPDLGAGIVYGRQLACGSISHLYNSLCRILHGQPPELFQTDADLLFGTQYEHD